MGCIFNCFRARDDESPSDSVSQVKSKRDHVSKNRLSALFASEEKAASSPCDDREGSNLNSMHIDKDLKDEAHFLKACSTTPAKPFEIRKASQHGEHLGSSPSLISSNSDAVFHLDDIKNEPCEEMGRSLDTSDQTLSSCLTDARNNERISSASSDGSEESIGTVLREYVDITGMVPLKAGNIKKKTKSVRSECYFDQCYSSSSSINSTSREQAKVQACKEKTEKSPTSTICEGKLKDSSNETHRIGETSNSPRKKHSNKNMEAISITPWDKPIIGMVAAHWNEKEHSQISPKWWDGNGIPNSTNKYKEDQKVNWHETSFEERLEKALSEEGGSKGFIPSRRPESVEESEKDTAISHLRHSAESMSVVSF